MNSTYLHVLVLWEIDETFCYPTCYHEATWMIVQHWCIGLEQHYCINELIHGHKIGWMVLNRIEDKNPDTSTHVMDSRKWLKTIVEYQIWFRRWGMVFQCIFGQCIGLDVHYFCSPEMTKIISLPSLNNFQNALQLS